MSGIRNISLITTLALGLLFSCTMFDAPSSAGQTFYIDPAAGSPDGDGSADHPWRTLQEVVEEGKIKAYVCAESYPNEQTPWTVVNPEGTVGAGDTLILRGGHHGELEMRGYFLRDLTIRAAEGERATLSGVRLYAASGICLSGLEIRPDAGYESGYTLVEILSNNFWGPTSGITVENCLIYSVEDSSGWSLEDWNTLPCTGVSVRDAEDVLVQGNLIRNVSFGVSIYDSDKDTVRKNRIENFSGDGMRGVGSDLVFEYNWIQDNYNVNDNHDDGFQAFTTGTDYESLDNIILRGNVVIECTDQTRDFRGSLQGIGCFDGFFGNWRVENNLILVHAYHGISLYGANDCVIINNTVADPYPGTDNSRSWIMVTAHKNGTPSTDCLIRNNLAHSISTGGQRADHNATYTYDDLTDYFINPEGFDFRLSDGSPAIDRGTITEVPPFDLTGSPRVRGRTADLGAYEKDS